MEALALALATQLAPLLLGTVSPFITAAVKKGVGAVGLKVPNPAKPLLNGLIGAVVAGLAVTSPVAAPLGVAGAMLGAKVRDQFDK